MGDGGHCAAGTADVLKRDDPGEALRYSFLLLKFRPRSVREMEFRLEKKGFSRAVTGGTVAFLKSKKFLDDASFARAWAQSRAARSYGLSRIGRELSCKGVDEDLAGQALGRLVADGYSETKAALELVSARKSSLLRDKDALKRKRRLFAFLSRRGFSPGVVSDVIKEFSGGRTAGEEYED